MSLQKVTVKTLDSKNHEFDVSEDLTVKQFKEVISPVVSIPVENQRLIFRGRVLQDDKKILEYNVANNTIHLVQRPNAPPAGSNPNDEPPIQRGGDDRFDGSGHGIIITAGTSPTDQNAIFMGTIGIPSVDIPSVGEQTVHPMNPSGVPRRASSASVRLQIGNDMINRASALLTRLEEDDEISAAQAQIVASSSSVPTTNTTTSNNDDEEDESHDSQSSDSNAMEIDPEDPGSFNRMISQVANAAVLASVRNMNPNSNDGMNILGQLAGGSSNNDAPAESNIGIRTPNNSNNNNNNNNRRPEAPRVRELAIALQDLIAFQERLVPFLQFVQNLLRENRSFNSETGELQSMQFVYDQVSSILHLLGHGLHAFSDLVCDFSSPPQNRRLISAPGILVEQSTVVRATIPVPVAAFASNIPTNPNPTQQQQQQQNQFAGIWSQLAGNNNTNNPQQQQQSSASPNTAPPSNAQRGPSIFSTNPSHGNLPTGISINIQSNGMPDLASLLAGATGTGGAINAGVLPFLSFGNLQQQQQPPRAQQQQSNNSSTSGTGINSNPNNTTTTNTNNNNANNNNNNNTGAGNLQQTLRNELMRSPFDILLSCHSHHASRNRPRQRPSNLHSHVKIEPSTPSHATTSFDFFQSLIDLIRSSNCLELFQPYFKDIIQNYLMRGRDVKNQLHVKTCAKTIAKKHTNFFKSFVDNIAENDATIDMQKTLSELVSKFYFKLFSLVLNSGPREFRNSVILLWEDSMAKLFTIFRVCFPNNNNRVPELLAKAVVDEYFVGASLIFKTYAKTSLQDYFVAFCSQITDGSVQTNGLIIKVVDDGSSSSSNQQASLSTPSSSNSLTQTPISNNPASSTSPPVSSPPAKKNTFDSMDIETDIDIDNLIAPAPPTNTNDSARTELNRIERIPAAWRDVVLEDINRQLHLVNQQPPSRSVGFSTLFPRKN